MTRVGRATLLALVIVPLAGCVTVEEREARACTKLGFPPDSDGYWNCMQFEEQRRQANMAASMQMLQVGGQLLAPPPTVNVYTH